MTLEINTLTFSTVGICSLYSMAGSKSIKVNKLNRNNQKIYVYCNICIFLYWFHTIDKRSYGKLMYSLYMERRGRVNFPDIYVKAGSFSKGLSTHVQKQSYMCCKNVMA